MCPPRDGSDFVRSNHIHNMKHPSLDTIPIAGLLELSHKEPLAQNWQLAIGKIGDERFRN